MRIAVTGGSGFVGRELVKMLLSQGYSVTNIDLVPSGIDGVDKVHDLTTGDVNLEADFCFHLASATGGLLFNQRADVIAYNSEVNKNVFKSCCDIPILFVSTLNVFEGCKTISDKMRPETSYARSKLEGEQYFELNAINGLHIVRPSNIFGASQLSKFIAYGESHVIPDLLNKIDTLDVLEVWGDGSQQRNFLHVKDLCNYLIGFLHGGEKVSNVCSSITLSVEELVRELLRVRQRNLSVVYNSLYMKYEKMFISDIFDELINIGSVCSILEGIAM